MSLNWDATGLDIGDFAEWGEWRERREYSPHTNGELLEALIWRLIVLRPTPNGKLTPKTAYDCALRNVLYEAALGSRRGIHIPADFIRRCIGLSTNVFPRATDAEFMKTLLEAARQAVGDKW